MPIPAGAVPAGPVPISRWAGRPRPPARSGGTNRGKAASPAAASCGTTGRRRPPRCLPAYQIPAPRTGTGSPAATAVPPSARIPASLPDNRTRSGPGRRACAAGTAGSSCGRGTGGTGPPRNNFPSQLSGGEQQRVAIARAIAKNPSLLLCDEPTGALDYQTGKKVLKILQDRSLKKNSTVIIVTHNAALAPIADKVIRIQDGKVKQIENNSSPQDIAQIEW